MRHQLDYEKPVRLSDRLKRALFDVRFRGELQSRLAIQAGLHPSTLSKFLHGAAPVQPGDLRVVRLGELVGISAAECFEQRGEPVLGAGGQRRGRQPPRSRDMTK